MAGTMTREQWDEYAASTLPELEKQQALLGTTELRDTRINEAQTASQAATQFQNAQRDMRASRLGAVNTVKQDAMDRLAALRGSQQSAALSNNAVDTARAEKGQIAANLMGAQSAIQGVGLSNRNVAQSMANQREQEYRQRLAKHKGAMSSILGTVGGLVGGVVGGPLGAAALGSLGSSVGSRM